MRALPLVILGTSIAIAGHSAWASDDCGTATPISSLPFTTTLDTTTASSVPADPVLSCSGAADNSVWFTYTASKTVTLLFDTNGSDHSTAIAVFTDGCTAATEIACAQDHDSDNRTQLLVPVAAGTTIHVYVASESVGGGSLVLNVSRSILDATPPTSVRAAVSSGDPTPLGGAFSRFISAAALSKTDVAFTATTQGVFLHDGSTTTAIAMSGDPTPLGGTYSNFGRPVTGAGGRVAFFSTINNGTVDGAIFVHLAGVTTSLVARGDPAPGGGTFGSIVRGIAMSPNGLWLVFIADTSLESSEAVWLASTIGGGIFGPLLTEGDPSPCGGSVGTLGNAAPTLAINDATAMAVYAQSGTSAILRGTLPGIWSAVACEGQPTPLGGTYRAFRRNVRIGNNPTATVAYLSTVALPGPDTEAVFARSSGGAFVVAARGDLTTGGQTIDAFSSTAVADVTAASDVIFTARTDPGNRDAVLVRSITAAQATALLLEGDACPAGGVVGVLDTWVDVDAATGAAVVRAACTGGNGIFAIPAGGGVPSVVALSTDATPAGPGFAYDDPSRQGPHSAFLGTRTAVYRMHCDDATCDAPTVVAQPLVPAPGLPGETIATINGELVTGQGNLVAFAATTQGTARRGAIFAVRGGLLELVVAEGATLPGTSTVISIAPSSSSFTAIAANVAADTHNVAFVANISDVNDPIAFEGVYLARSGGITEVVREGQLAPNGEPYDEFEAPLVKGTSVSFLAATGPTRCVVRAAGATRRRSLACEGDTIDTPVGTTLDRIGSDAPGLGSKGPVVQIRMFAGSNECLLATSTSGPTAVVCSADPLPHGGDIRDFSNNGFKIAAGRRRIVASAVDDDFLNTGLFAFGSRVRARVAGDGQPTPVGGVYSIFDPRPSLYGKTLVFLADVNSGGLTQQALFVAKLRR